MHERTILIVEDEEKIVTVLADYLRVAGFDVAVSRRGDEVVPQIRRQTPALILLDIMLPGLDGLSVCREIRRFSEVPIIMITARVEEIDRLLGLELGADDYICKPFSPREVVARVKAVLRRSESPRSSAPVSIGPLQLDREKHKASLDGEVLNLTRSEFELLHVLVSHPERVFSRQELVDRVQGYEFGGYERTIDTHIKNIRKKLAAVAPGLDFITTIYGIGYQLNPPPAG